ncbi:TnsD family Tn7-like transposition protein [Collimonas arenae]|uniref:TnsD family Tn7-like transposition protein n=1 Tax=Collimonas arenae TaxID=279058 RepID=UPI0018D35D73|nr:TnsD family Tn7-like transposition protein [Collimonas arenae]
MARSPATKSRHLDQLGLRIASANSLVPNNLPPFVEVLPASHPWADTPSRIILDHTLIPLFLRFSTAERSAEVIAEIAAGRSRNPTATVGLTPSRSTKLLHKAKICPDCVARDIATHGFPVLYRQHQPSFVRMCDVHAKPLYWNCVRCQELHRHTRMWQMAGRCNCHSPLTQAVLNADLNVKTDENWLWLSHQVAIILGYSNVPTDHSITEKLLNCLKENGFSGTTGGLDSSAVADALNERFGRSFLQQLDLGNWCELLSNGHRANRVLSRDVIEGRKIPNVLHVLLLARLVVADISILSDMELTSKVQEKRCPTGYGRRASSCQALDNRTIDLAVQSTEGKITVAARVLGVHSYVLAAEMRRNGLRLPLPNVTAKRLGIKRIHAIQEALKKGIPKKDIQHLYKISEWSILLIELDDLDLSNAHRNATIERQRENHRTALLKYCEDHPSPSRSAFVTMHAGAFDWLREYDRTWLEGHLPLSIRGVQKILRQRRKDWPAIDTAAAAIIRKAALDEINKIDRPTWLTRTRLLTIAGALGAIERKNEGKFPNTRAEAKRLSEGKKDFQRRIIDWALQEYAGLQIPISINQLRRVARMSPCILLEQRSYIVAKAEELGLVFDTRCSLAPR